MYRITKDESGSYGSSVVGQATELPLESDFHFLLYSRINRAVIAILKECFYSFRPDTLRQTLDELDAYVGRFLVKIRVIQELQRSFTELAHTKLPKLSGIPAVRAKRMSYNPDVLAHGLLENITRLHYQFPTAPEQELLDGEIRFGTKIIQEEFVNRVRSVAQSARTRSLVVPTIFSRLLREIDVQLWLIRSRIVLAYKQFSYNPQPAYARATRIAGNGFIGIALFTIVFFGAPFLALELRSVVFRMTAPVVTHADPQDKPQVVVADPIVTPDEDKEFQIKIPMIGVDAKVMANVDANNQLEYEEALKHGVAHAKGTGLPGGESEINKSIFIFSHSTNGSWNISRFNALFYSLKDLKPEDQIQIWFWGKEYWYKVVEQKIVEPSDVSFLQPQTDKEQLVLQTCWPPGTTQKRLIITAERVTAE